MARQTEDQPGKPTKIIAAEGESDGYRGSGEASDAIILQHPIALQLRQFADLGSG